MPRTNLNSAYQQTNKTIPDKLCRSKINSVQQHKIIINNQLKQTVLKTPIINSHRLGLGHTNAIFM